MSRDLAVTVGTSIGLLTILPGAPTPETPKFDVTVRAYMTVLKGKPFEARHVETAMARLLTECKFFPTPAEFCQAVREVWLEEPRPVVVAKEAPALPAMVTPLEKRPDRDEFLRIRARAHERLGIAEAERQMAGRQRVSIDRHELEHRHLTATVPDPDHRKRLEEQRAAILHQKTSK